MLYVLERFLYRLALSDHRQRLILKGGMLLAALGDRRPTRDVDLLAVAIANDIEVVGAVVKSVLEIEVDDGVVFEPSRIAAETIREQDLYAGVRMTVPARLDRAEVVLRLDVNVGDPVTPAPSLFSYPALLGEPFPVVGYPVETVLAEKIVTMIDRGDATTRERDFGDVALIARRHEIDGTRLTEAIRATATHRGTQLTPISVVLVTLGRDRQTAWTAYTRRSGLEHQLPPSYVDTISAIADFADPVLRNDAIGLRWSPENWRWQKS